MREAREVERAEMARTDWSAWSKDEEEHEKCRENAFGAI